LNSFLMFLFFYVNNIAKNVR